MKIASKDSLNDGGYSKDWESKLFLFSAENTENLSKDLNSFIAQFKQENCLYDASLNLAEKFQYNSEIIAIIADSYEDLLDKINETLAFIKKENEKLPKAVFKSSGLNGKLAVLFSGQGSQYTSMIEGLKDAYPLVNDIVQESNDILKDKFNDRFGKELIDFIYPEKTDDKDALKKLEAELTSTDVTQPALGAVESAIFKLFEGFGLNPDMLAGHSYGEFAALYAAGKINFNDLMLISEARGRLIVDKAKEGGQELGSMAAIRGNRGDVEKIISDIEDVVIANHNAHEQIIISGSDEAVTNACAKFKEVKIKSIKLPVAAAFHSKFVEPAQKDFVEVLNKVNWQAGSQALVYSNNTAKPHEADIELVKKSMSAHLTGPVEFVEQINNMYSDGARVFIEIGPKNVLTKLTQNILKGKDFKAVAVDDNGKGTKGLLFAVCELICCGVELDIKKIFNNFA